MAQHQFQTEVNELLHLIIHSLYSNKEIFLRELVSNASDALDKLKYLTVADEAYKAIRFEPRIDITFTESPAAITVADNGIGMNEGDIIESLGTIARSGTKSFLKKLSQEGKKDSGLIGQFGVGFYSAFMVAEKIEVISRKAGEDSAWKWSSRGEDSYETESASRESHGTTVILSLSKEGAAFANRWAIQEIVKRYSNHIAFPIYLTYDQKEYDDKGNEKGSRTKTEQINSGTALWRRPKAELTDEDYRDFYKQLGYDTSDPLLYIHTKAEGTLEYTTLFYIPETAPFDLYHVDCIPGVKLYVKRVFITENDKNLLPGWLRFVRGVIDSEDLPLNVSREILQQNKILLNIRHASVKKLLTEFKTLSEHHKEKWEIFISQFNRPLKEGLYHDTTNRDILEELVRFKSTTVEGWTSLAEYAARMKSGQKHIFYITGGDEKTLRASPLLEAYRAKDVEVLIMDDEIDEVVMSATRKYKDWEIKAISRSDAEADLGKTRDKQAEKTHKPVIEKIAKALGDRVKKVKLSCRLHDSPSCIVADENDPSLQMAHILKAMGQPDIPDIKVILEINAEHPIVARLKDEEDEQRIADIAGVLLDQALLLEGVKLKDPGDFVGRINRLLAG
jgi:molecular chaperone HtpG